MTKKVDPRLVAAFSALLGKRVHVNDLEGPAHDAAKNLETLFTFMGGGAVAQQAIILIPENWGNRLAKDRARETGALVFVGSQAVDAYNGRFHIDLDSVVPRARAYEAEYLRVLRDAPNDWHPDAYQQKVLADFPRGIRSPTIRECIYTPRTVEAN